MYNKTTYTCESFDPSCWNVNAVQNNELEKQFHQLPRSLYSFTPCRSSRYQDEVTVPFSAYTYLIWYSVHFNPLFHQLVPIPADVVILTDQQLGESPSTRFLDSIVHSNNKMTPIRSIKPSLVFTSAGSLTHPVTPTQWQNSLQYIKFLYFKGRLKQCAAQCRLLLQSSASASKSTGTLSPITDN